jgi:hypothetical protein
MLTDIKAKFLLQIEYMILNQGKIKNSALKKLLEL